MLSTLRWVASCSLRPFLELVCASPLLLTACSGGGEPNSDAEMLVTPGDSPSGEMSAGPAPASSPPGVISNGPQSVGPTSPGTGNPAPDPVVSPTPVASPPSPTANPGVAPSPPNTQAPAPTPVPSQMPAGGGGAEPGGAGGAPLASGGAGGAEVDGGGAPGVAGQGTGGTPAVVGICPASPGTAPSGTLAATLVDGVEAEDYDYHLFEGAAWLGDAVYFSDIKPSPWNSTIRKYVPATGMVSNFLVGAGSNGLAVSSGGELYSATAGKGQISRYSLDSAMQETVVPGPFNSPNDLTIASDGTIYFSDPQQGELPSGNQPQFVHVVKGGVDAIFSEELTAPNGVALAPDESILYVSGGGFTGYVKKVTLVDGLAGSVEDLVTELQVPDGLGVDCTGNVYVALHETQQIGVYAPSGERLATITLGSAANGQAAKPTNVAFGGSDRKTLYVTAAYSLWEVLLDIAGYPN